MNKRGIGTIVIVLIVAVVLAVLIFGFGIGNTTGNATYTKGANYGVVENTYQNDIECVYVGPNDGWDVTVKSSVRYNSITKGQFFSEEDSCVDGDAKLIEYHCEDGYMKIRRVTCPYGTTCSDGVCS